MRNQLVEIWQANAAGRYTHKSEQHPAPLDPNFTGRAPSPTTMATIGSDDQARRVPVAQPPNAWRPAHIHFSVFGSEFTQRIVTQMYFPGTRCSR